MPFQSEKQRRYLWANEPEIARDWADTYGSRIEKNSGGISQLVKSGPGRPGYRGDDARKSAAAMGKGAMGTAKHGGTDTGGGVKHHHSVDTKEQIKEQKKADVINQRARLRDEVRRQEKEKREEKVEVFRHKALNNPFNKIKRHIPYIGLLDKFVGPTYHRDFFLDEVLGKGYYEGISEKDFYDLSSVEQEKALKDYNRARGMGEIDAYGRPIGPKRGDGQGGGYMGYPSYEAWKAAQGQGGTTEVAEVVEDVPSAFQTSLTTNAGTPNYYVGDNPLASNIAWGKQAGVDPRTMGIYNQNQYGFPTWAAEGGRVPAAFGGIMDSSTGRRAYGLGSIFKKIGRAAKKVLKSDIGKAAIIAAGGYYLGGGGNPFTAAGRGGFSWANLKSAPFVKQLLTKEGAGLAWDPWKVGIGALSALPFFMGQPEDEDEDKGVDYDLLRDKYASELMNIKRGVMAGSLNPNEFSYLPSNYTYTGAEGGRAGYYAGGQSVPSDYTMEDARMTTTQDKLGGITEAMKRADLYRKGSVGQMYAADGGRIGYDAGGQTGYPPIIMGQIQAPPQMPAPQVPQTPMPAPQPNPMAMNPMMNRPMMNPMGGRVMAQEGGLMDLGGMEKDYRNDGGFVPIGGEEKADDVPARLSKNEFVFTADAVRGAGGGDIDKGAEIMENVMKNLEEGGQISEETQGLSGAQEMFGVSERLSEVI